MSERRTLGFTLLELLVAMALMVVVSASLYTSLYTAFRARRSSAAAIVPTTEAINVLTLLKDDILGTLQPSEGLVGDFVGTDAQGDKGFDEDSLSFYTTHVQTLPDSPAGGTGMIELLLTENEENKVDESEAKILVRRVTTNLLATSTEVVDDQVLCRNVRSLNFRYHDGTDWLDSWDSSADSNGLPVAVEIDLEMEYVTEGHNSQILGRYLTQSFPLACGGPAPEVTTEGEAGGEEMQQSTGGR